MLGSGDTRLMENNNERIKGRITKVQNKEGWGFIYSDDRLFTRFHFSWSNLLHSTKEFTELRVDDMVEFTPMKDENGWHALKIKVL